jgi:predicted RNA binding protein with dsRBD fold (UPF0201 family)
MIAVPLAVKRPITAFQGVINFVVGNPDELGDIGMTVTMREPDVESMVDAVAPPTEVGTLINPESAAE